MLLRLKLVVLSQLGSCLHARMWRVNTKIMRRAKQQQQQEEGEEEEEEEGGVSPRKRCFAQCCAVTSGRTLAGVHVRRSEAET